jgi:hypothetical protein
MVLFKIGLSRESPEHIYILITMDHYIPIRVGLN